VNDRFPTGRFAQEVRDLQVELNAQGYGPVQVDGWFGPATKAALADRDADLAATPLPAKPWWRTDRARGLLVAALGTAALFVPALREVDTAYLVELIWLGLDQADQIVTVVGAIITLFGGAWSAIGAAKAKAPIDATLVARVKGRDIRIGKAPDALSMAKGAFGGD